MRGYGKCSWAHLINRQSNQLLKGTAADDVSAEENPKPDSNKMSLSAGGEETYLNSCVFVLGNKAGIFYTQIELYLYFIIYYTLPTHVCVIIIIIIYVRTHLSLFAIVCLCAQRL